MQTPITPQPKRSTKLEETPLLPPVLTGAAAFFWLWVLPLCILLLLNLQAYWLIEGNMGETERANAVRLGLCLLVNIGVGIALYCFTKYSNQSGIQKTIWALPVILAQIAYLWVATAMTENLLPQSVTVWIYPPQRYFYNQYAFCMLPLFWGILRVACGNAYFLSNSIGKNLLIAILAPVTLFIGLKAFGEFGGSNFATKIGPVIVASAIIILGVMMFVAVIRGIMLLLRRLNGWNTRTQIIAILILAFVLPVGGLLLNRSIPFPVDFQAWEVYALVILNTAFLVAATIHKNSAPRLSFWLLCASFPFTLYFFVVFLPFTPLSILAVMALGTGFLVMTPTLLFTLHVYHLISARRRAQVHHTTKGILFGGALCFLCLPTFFTVRGLLDKTALNHALDYLYTPNFETVSVEYPGSRINLKRALASHRNYKNGIYYPLLSDYYSWLVFDNLILPDDKIEKLELTFFGSTGSSENIDPVSNNLLFRGNSSVRNRSSMPRAQPPSREVEIIEQDLKLSARNDKATQATLTLKLKNVSDPSTWGGAEYVNQLAIPPGILINGFRLHINGTPVPGRIFEKKTALWVYNMIRDSERRDPGLLVYNNPREVELRIFPINHDQPATVEIDFLIPDDLESIAKPEMPSDPARLLPLLVSSQAQVAQSDHFTYIAPLDTATLPSVKREHTLHIILDRSQDNGITSLTSAELQNLSHYFPQVTDATITLANYNVVKFTADQTKLAAFPGATEAELNKSLPIQGGFDLDRAISHAIAQYTHKTLDTSTEAPAEPIFIVLGRTKLTALPPLEKTQIWRSHLSQLQIYTAARDDSEIKPLSPQNQNSVPLIRIGNSVRPAHPLRSLIFPASNAAPEYYAPDSQTWRALPHDLHTGRDTWTEAINLWVGNHQYAANPGNAELSLKELVSRSRNSGVMIPASSYIVVENEAQWRMLQQKEGQKLDQNEALDFLETPAPATWVMLLGLSGWLIWRKRCAQHNETAR